MEGLLLLAAMAVAASSSRLPATAASVALRHEFGSMVLLVCIDVSLGLGASRGCHRRLCPPASWGTRAQRATVRSFSGLLAAFVVARPFGTAPFGDALWARLACRHFRAVVPGSQLPHQHDFNRELFQLFGQPLRISHVIGFLATVAFTTSSDDSGAV